MFSTIGGIVFLPIYAPLGLYELTTKYYMSIAGYFTDTGELICSVNCPHDR